MLVKHKSWVHRGYHIPKTRPRLLGRIGSSGARSPNTDETWRRFRAKLIVQELGDEYRLSQKKGAAICQPNEELAWEEDLSLAQLESFWAVPLQTLEQGCVLVASSTLAESSPFSSHLHEVVIFIVSHSSEQGSIGLILNRPSILTMSRTMMRNDAGDSQLRDIFGDNRLYCGGNRDQEIIKILHRYGDVLPGREIIPGVYESNAVSSAKEQYSECKTSAFKFFSGYEYWAPGELQKEVDMGMYTITSCSKTLILKNCLSLPIPLWCEINLRLGGEYAEEAIRVYGGRWST